MPTMVAQKSEMSAKAAIAKGFGFLAGQKSEMSAIVVYAGTLVRWTQEKGEIMEFPHKSAGMPTYAAHGCPEVGNVCKLDNSGVVWLLVGEEVGKVGKNCV